MSDSNRKMENESESKCNITEAADIVNCDGTTHINSEAENAKKSREENSSVGDMTGASPPAFVFLEEVVKAVHGMKNMALAHEIALDKNFQLQKLEPENDTLHGRVKEVMHKAFWNILAEELAAKPPNYALALVLLNEMKESLNELVLPHHRKIRDNIKEVLDVDLIKQQAERGVLDFHHYAHYIISIMSKVCAPVRDEKIRELANQTDVIETFKGIMETLQLMRLDLANFTITTMRPNIVASSVEYEKAKFAEFMKVNANDLQDTERWLLKHLHIDKAVSYTDVNVIKQITHCLLAEAYLDLLEWDSKPQAETLMLDERRLLELRDKTSRLCIIASIILLINNTVGPAIHGVSSFKNTIKEHLTVLLDTVHSNKDLESVMPNIVLQVKADVRKTLQEINSPEMLPDRETLLEGQLMDLTKTDHKIRNLVNLRVRQFLQKIILSQTTAPQQVPPGLSSLQEELTAIAAQFLILVAHNRRVYGEYYQDIVANALSKTNATDSKAASTSNFVET